MSAQRSPRIRFYLYNPQDAASKGLYSVQLPFDPNLTIPSLTEVELPIPHPEAIGDVEGHARAQVVERLGGSVSKGMTVAVGAGSRGLVERVALLRGAIRGLRDLGAEPFVDSAGGDRPAAV